MCLGAADLALVGVLQEQSFASPTSTFLQLCFCMGAWGDGASKINSMQWDQFSYLIPETQTLHQKELCYMALHHFLGFSWTQSSCGEGCVTQWSALQAFCKATVERGNKIWIKLIRIGCRALRNNDKKAEWERSVSARRKLKSRGMSPVWIVLVAEAMYFFVFYLNNLFLQISSVPYICLSYI